MMDNTPLENPASEHAAPPPEKERAFVSAGQRIHHWGTYLGVDWILNAASGVSFAYWGKFTKSGQKYWSEPVDKFLNTTLKPLLKNPEHLKEGIKQGNTFISIIAGGMMTIPPLLTLENKKSKKTIVKTLDNIVYGKDTVENDPKFQESYSEMDNAPKKDFSTGMIARFAALAPLLASVIIPASKEKLVKYYFTPIGKGTRAIAENVGITEGKVFGKFAAKDAKERWDYCHDESLAMDLGFGLPYAGLHSFFYNKFSKMRSKPERNDSIDIAATTPATVNASSQTPEQPAPQAATMPSTKIQHTTHHIPPQQVDMGQNASMNV